MPQWLLRAIWAVAWRLLPREFRSRFGAELADTIASAAGAARGKGGRLAETLYLTREIGTFVRLAFALHRTSSRDELRWAVRRASRQPVATTTVVLTLAATIAALTTAFGLADAVLWRPLPYANAERLVFVWERSDGPQQAPMRVTASRFVDWRTSTAFSGIAIFAAAGFTLDGNDGATAVRGVRVSPNYFDVLGVQPLLGRTFAADEDVPGRHQVIVLSDEFWRGQFGADPNVVGREIRLSGQPYTVIGVMPPLMYPGWPVNPARVTVDRSAHQFWVPVPNTPAFAANARSHVWGTLARLAPGVTLDAAARAIGTSSGTAADSHGAALQPLREQFVSDARVPLLLLLVAAAAVMMVACANLAAVQIATFETRRTELAMRTALGASAARLARQLTFEALVQSGLAGLAGITVSRLALTMIPRWLPPHIPFMTTPQLNVRVALFGSAIALMAGIALAAWPIASVLTGRVASRGVASRGRRSVYRGLVVMQVATAVGVVTAAALLVQSLQRVVTRDTGFEVDNIVVAQVSLPSAAFRTPESVVQFEVQLRERVSHHTGVVDVALAYDHPLVSNWSNSYTLIGRPENLDDDSSQQAELRIVSPSYFDTLHVEVLHGRVFADREATRAPGVVVVNESLAREIGGIVLGRRIRLSPPRFTWGDGVPEEFEIVGVVEDERFRGVEAPSLPALYVSTRQFPQTSFALLTATRGELGGIATTLRSAVRALDRQATVTPARALAAIADEQLAPRRVTTEVIGGLSGASLVLAALGVYGLLAVAVATRRREIGLRMAVGASPMAVGRHILFESLTTTAWGIGIGAALAFFASRLLEGMLVGVTAHDPLTFGLVSVTLLLVAAGAALVPAFRAARTDPAITLRPE